MALEGLAAIQARIAHIEQLVNAKRAQTASDGTAGSTTSGESAGDFASVLSKVSGTTKVADATRFTNGKIPDSALVSIGGGEKLTAPAAAQFQHMQAVAQKSGVKIGVNDSYRSYDEQVEMAKTKGLYSQGGLAAKPGTSTHGLGISVDLQLDAKAQTWMKQNGKQFGFVNDVKNESWHWTYKGA